MKPLLLSILLLGCSASIGDGSSPHADAASFCGLVTHCPDARLASDVKDAQAAQDTQDAFDAKDASDASDARETYKPESTTWSEYFLETDVPSNRQCASWNDWRSKIPRTSVYSKLTVRGAYNMTGVSCLGYSADILCQGLRDGGSLSVVCGGGATWSLWDCDGDMLLSPLNASACVCDKNPSGYAVSPCRYDGFGGVNTSSCPAPGQTMTVTCE